MSKQFSFPTYRVSLRHPIHGWQVVALAYCYDDCEKMFRDWIIVSSGECHVTMQRMDDKVPQVWLILDDHNPFSRPANNDLAAAIRRDLIRLGVNENLLYE